MRATDRRDTGAPALRAVASAAIPTLEDLRTPVWVYDVERYRIHWANRAALVLWEADHVDELLARDFRPDTSHAVDSALHEFLGEFARGRTVTEWWQISPRGLDKRVLCLCSGFTLEDGRPAMLVEALREGVGGVVESAASALMLSDYDDEGRLQSGNPPFHASFDEEATDFASLFADPAEAAGLLAAARASEEPLRADARMLTRSGPRWHSLELRPAHRGGDEPSLLVLQTDVHERKSRELALASEAVTDVLTGLGNRLGMQRRLAELRESGRPFSLFYVDLDGFKLVNDTFGHAVGDELLAQVADRLVALAGEAPMVARIGGDEFVVAGDAEALQATPDAFATWLVSSLSQPYHAREAGALSLSCSVGIACFPEHGGETDELLANADTAMYAAKARGRRRWIRYAPGMRDRFRRRARVAQALPGAGARGELSLAYQPVVLAPANELVAVEALLRWNSLELGVIPPLEAVAAAEETGLIGELEEWVLERAGLDLPRLRRVFGSHVAVNVNVSGHHLAQPDFVTRLEAHMARLALLPGDVVLELTEGAMVPDGSESGANVDELGARGHRIAIDDFGTGYSCLAYLHRLPADYVKIDRAFVARLHEDRATVPGIHALAGGFGMRTVAEGVETEAQAAMLREHGVLLQQGYLFGRPQPLRDLLAR